MIIGLISDTHDNVESVRKSVEVFKRNKVDFAIHFGDVVAPLTMQFFSGLKMKFVKGNCDGDVAHMKKKVSEINGEFFESQLTMAADGKRISALHGDNEMILDQFIKSQKYYYVFHGHTHQKKDERVGKTRVINPGAHYPTVEENTVAILDMEKDNVNFIEV